MKSNNDIKIEIVSKINDEIIERATNTRNKLIKKPKKNIKKMVMAIGITAASIVIMLSGVLYFILGGGTVPVYEGMTVSENNPMAGSGNAVLPSQNATLPGAGNGNNGNHYGQYKGDHVKDNDDINQDDPFENGESIEGAVDSNISAEPGKDIYYAKPNEDVFVTVHINNPSGYEILSFTLNGIKYTSYMFEYGSNLENLILKVNVGNVEGVVDYTIDQIKYVDGTDIKDVKMEGDRTVKIGVATKKQPEVTLSIPKASIDSISFRVSLEDELELIKQSNGKVQAALYDGENIVSLKDVTENGQEIMFDGLKQNTLYQYGVIVTYDDLLGDGVKTHLLSSRVIYTSAPVLYDNIKLRNDGIDFDLVWFSEWSDKTFSSIVLKKDGDVISNLTVDSNKVSISGLLSDNEYSVVAEYQNNEETESIQLDFKTSAKRVPNMRQGIIQSLTTHNSIPFSTNYSDFDDTVLSITYELLHGNDEPITEYSKIDGLDTFTDLKEYTEYTFRLTAVYDLNNGEGPKTIVKEESYKTLATASIHEFSAVTTGALFEGDSALGQIIIKNDSEIRFTSITVNGKSYNVLPSSLDNRLFFDIKCDELGANNFVLEEIKGELNGVEYVITPDRDLSATVYINKRAEIVSVEFVNSEYNHIDWAFPSEIESNSVYLKITLKDFEGYIIEGVSFDYRFFANDAHSSPRSFYNSNPVKISENEYYIEMPFDDYFKPTAGWNVITFKDVDYGNDNVSNQAISYHKEIPLFVVSSNEVKYISTPEDLLNMEDMYYYELANDIDIGGSNWQGGDLNGILNGNGFSINNFTYIANIKNQNLYIGLFDTVHGLIHDVEMKNVFIMVDLVCDRTDVYGHVYNMQCGAFAPRTGLYTILDNCSVDSTSSIMVKKTGDGTNALGGLVGSNCGIIKNCINKAIVSGNEVVGGIAGENIRVIIGCENTGNITTQGEIVSGIASGNELYNCINRGKITGKQHVAGIAAFADEIIDCKNYGEISGNQYTGGMTADGNVVLNCENYGKISGGVQVGGIAATAIRIENCINRGDISSSAMDGHIAGIVAIFHGQGHTKPEIKECVNYGKISYNQVSGNVYMAGIVASSFDVDIENCKNYGTFKTSGQGQIGAIVAYFARGNVIGCANYADIEVHANYSGSSHIGIASSGYMGDVYDSYNYGIIYKWDKSNPNNIIHGAYDATLPE